MGIKYAKQNLNNTKEFIKHNLNLGYIKEDMTVVQLLEYINNVETNYIPMMEKIENNIKL